MTVFGVEYFSARCRQTFMYTGKIWMWVECSCKATERCAQGLLCRQGKRMKHIMNGIKENTSEVQKPQERP